MARAHCKSAAVLVLFMLTLAVCAQDRLVGQIAELKSKVNVIGEQGVSALLKNGDTVHAGDSILTDPKSPARRGNSAAKGVASIVLEVTPTNCSEITRGRLKEQIRQLHSTATPCPRN